MKHTLTLIPKHIKYFHSNFSKTKKIDPKKDLLRIYSQKKRWICTIDSFSKTQMAYTLKHV
ncbi:Uncharacterised protein [Myroides odoratus]|uniref:Uncharacterized protein n=1 Tax=Myroides odoratus TaxID=256 RepID=A0A378RHS8_MYROD|nr:Uncharacterised protein [Myroides odoratus]